MSVGEVIHQAAREVVRGRDLVRRWGLSFVLTGVTSLLVTGCSFGGPTRVAAATAGSSVLDHPFRAQVVGVQWLNPLVRRDYTTEWQLLWTLELASPNRNDDMVRTEPKSFTTVQPVAAIVSNSPQRKTFEDFYFFYTEEIFLPFRNRYASNPTYFYTVQPRSPKQWRELAGIHIELALPDRPDLNRVLKISGSPSVSSPLGKIDFENRPLSP
ncbi:hypothetical protein [Parazoarcus communis]|uniref:hypothetical protein n=1 Tax=Parazoarcus communis TaxID=41977 RepID=UPI00131EFA2A|nr:hypothetical protein [Parazoarcus communis]